MNPTLSPDGTKLLFVSEASDLGVTDTNRAADIYLRDLTTGQTSLVSVNADGTDAGNDGAGSAMFDPTGDKVLFTSRSTDLALPGGAGTHADLYVRDLATGQTSLVSVNADGTGGGDNDSYVGQFSPDGQKVLFDSLADNLGSPSTGLTGVFERDLTRGTTFKVADGSMGDYSPSGGVIAFLRDRNVWLREAGTGALTNVSAGLPGWTDDARVRFSHDDRNFAFTRWTNDEFVLEDIYVYDRVTHTTTLATAAADGGGGSNGYESVIVGFHPSDRNQLLFTSTGWNLVANDTNRSWDDVFVRNLATSTTTLVSQNSAGTATGNGQSSWARWIADGSRIALVSRASDFGVTDTNSLFDVYVRHMDTGRYSLVSVNAAGDDAGNAESGRFQVPFSSSYVPELSISADGSRIAFGSNANDLGPTDDHRTTNPETLWFNHDVYVATFVSPP